MMIAQLQCPGCLPRPGKPAPMMWELVPTAIKTVLRHEGCTLLKHWTRRKHHSYIRFQYAPLVYQGDLFYLQRWSATEWHVSPSQLIFPHEGWPCRELTRRRGGKLSLLVRQTIADLFPGDSALSGGDRTQTSLASVS